jgi:RNA polymerase sigma-70 factor (sigma-E family)
LAEPDGFAAFVAARYPALVRTAFLFVGDRGHAEDLVQSALSRTYSHWTRLHDRSSVEAYTRTTMARLAGRWSHRRWCGELPSGSAPGTAESIDPVAGRAEALDLYAALGRLPWAQRAVLVLRYFEDLSEAETAGMVKSRASRAVVALRLEFPGLDGDTTMSEEATARE